ncbi:DUF6156 family protein [Teredinibacter turnerae]|uniref:Uncharacterized protein n=1 Tax=Teredinibacter turnerae (strain ATCC 39867 / T7901) TaxID=377629 RepID=C5BTC5_TERTT|nr:DUF6156 family protein [Teredinibacter turnerae]ACR11313.1 conserved hypothetical protein [Teredinibacter turnerae T7901]
MKANEFYDRYYLSYTGIKLPMKLVNPLDPAEIDNRNTFFGALLDDVGREYVIHKVVYGDVELSHTYHFGSDGALLRADIINADGEEQRIDYNK